VTAPKPKQAPNQFDEWVPDVKVRSEFDISHMTIHRWDEDPELAKLGWPPPIKLKDRKYRSRQQLEQFKKTMLETALKDRKQQHKVLRR
jgi:hypothetical protein